MRLKNHKSIRRLIRIFVMENRALTERRRREMKLILIIHCIYCIQVTTMDADILQRNRWYIRYGWIRRVKKKLINHPNFYTYKYKLS